MVRSTNFQQMGRRFIPLLFLIFLSFISCKDEPTAPEETNNIESTQKYIVDLQSNISDLLSNLLSKMDTVSAKDSVLKFFLKDTSVQSGMVTEQGISIKYKSGILGGLFIDPQDHPEIDSTGYPLPMNSLGKKMDLKSKATILLNPHYFERQKYTNEIIDYYNAVFPQVGYKEPEIYLNDEVTLYKLTQLSNYGIVHLYSHGMHFELNDEVYFLTGETLNLSTTTKYWDLINEGEIPLICQFKGKTKYFVSPKFISMKNNFSKDSTIVFGGFCYSYLGNWAAEMSTAGAIGYFGFDWSVLTIWNAYWATQLFYNLCDTSKSKPITIEDWYYNVDPPKRYWDDKDNRDVYIKFHGMWDYTLWSKQAVKNYSTSYIDLHIKGFNTRVTADSSYEDPYYEFYETYSPEQKGSLTDSIFTSSWNYSRTDDFPQPGTQVTWTGSIQIVFSKNFDKIISYTETNSENWPGWRTTNMGVIVKDIPFYQSGDKWTPDVYKLTDGYETCNSVVSRSYQLVWWDGKSITFSRNECDEQSYIEIKLYK